MDQSKSLTLVSPSEQYTLVSLPIRVLHGGCPYALAGAVPVRQAVHVQPIRYLLHRTSANEMYPPSPLSAHQNSPLSPLLQSKYSTLVPPPIRALLHCTSANQNPNPLSFRQSELLTLVPPPSRSLIHCPSANISTLAPPPIRVIHPFFSANQSSPPAVVRAPLLALYLLSKSSMPLQS